MKLYQKIITHLIFLLMSISVCAEDKILLPKKNKDIIFASLGLSLDNLNGEAFENVYSNGAKISELKWDIKNVKMLTLHSQFKYKDFAIRAKLGNGITGGNGGMVDSDWLGGPGFNDGNRYHDNWTHRSWSKVNVKSARDFDANISYNFFYNFHFNVGYRQTSFSWKDSAGNYVYSTSSLRDTVGSFGGVNAINYSQKMRIPYIGIEINQPLFNKKLLLNLSAAYSNKVNASDKDQHVLRNLLFKEEFRNGKYYNLAANVQYMIMKDASLGLGYEYSKVPEMIGDTSVLNYVTGSTSSCKNCAGFSNKYEKISLSFKYFFDFPLEGFFYNL